MKSHLLHLLLIGLASLSVCCSAQKETDLVATGPISLHDFQEEVSSESSGGSGSSSADRDVVRSAWMDLEVNSFDSAVHSLYVTTLRRGGYVANSYRRLMNGANGQGVVSGRVDLRIPADSFEMAIQEVRRLGVLKTERITSEDVTRTLLYLDARLRTQEQLEGRLLNLLSTRTGTLAEIIEIEDKLASVRQNIENVQGEGESLRGSAAMATLSVGISEPGALDTISIEDAGSFGKAIQAGLDKAQGVLVGIIEWSIILVPLGALLFLLYRIVRPMLRGRMRRTEPAASEESD